MIIITIEGKPNPWQAPRRNGNHYYSPNNLEKEQAKWQVKAQINNNLIEGPVKITALFFFTVPKQTSKIKTTQMLNNVIHHIKKPDLDNCTKFLLDCLKGIIFKDDNQVCELEVKKRYGLEAKTMIQIINLGTLREEII